MSISCGSFMDQTFYIRCGKAEHVWRNSVIQIGWVLYFHICSNSMTNWDVQKFSEPPSTVRSVFWINWSNEFFATNSTSVFFGQMFLGVRIMPIQFAKDGLVRRVSPKFPNSQFLAQKTRWTSIRIKDNLQNPTTFIVPCHDFSGFNPPKKRDQNQTFQWKRKNARSVAKLLRRRCWIAFFGEFSDPKISWLFNGFGILFMVNLPRFSWFLNDKYR